MVTINGRGDWNEDDGSVNYNGTQEMERTMRRWGIGGEMEHGGGNQSHGDN